VVEGCEVVVPQFEPVRNVLVGGVTA
jgi:hypothetical protein